MAEECGFDVDFVTDVPDYLKCSVCQFVLRNPVQVMNCNHRYCKTCFESMKRSAEQHNTQLRCSIDREDIDLSNVFQDTGIATVIGNLEVKCRNIKNGCSWTGDLRGLRLHEEQCIHGLINTSIQNKSTQPREMSALHARISKIEESAMEKEKDIMQLKFNLNELKKEFDQKEAEIELFKVENTNLASQVKLLKDQNQECKKLLERENERLKYLESQNELKKEFNEKEAEMELFKITNTRLASDVKLLKDQNQECKKLLERENKRLEFLESKNELKEEFNEKEAEIELFKLKNTSLESEVKLLKDQNQVHKKILDRENERLKFLESKNDTACCCQKYIFIFIFISIFAKQTQIELKVEEIARKMTTKFDDIGYQVATVENLLEFTVAEHTFSKTVMVQWKLHHYQYYYDIGEKVFSPEYFTQVERYSFRLYVTWSGEEKENFDLHFVLLPQTSSWIETKLEPFTFTTKLEVVDEKGKTFSRTFSNETSNWEPSTPWGFKRFLTTYHMRNYIVNDIVTIRCVFTRAAYLNVGN